MKEIDKIRIKQWNQDNPYIQMKNLENVQPGYRVHTVNDDHHLYELPLETQNIILDWVFWNFYPAQKIYPHLTSDDLKEVLYKRTQIHLHNNQFKEAMLINGFWPRDPSELNWVFHIQASSPAIRTQADGYPGIPIRTLHYYDEIGLLKPTEKSDAGYRLYDDKALETLQQVLFFREFDIPLKEIKAVMDNPVLERNQLLQMQRKMLVAKKERMERLITSIDDILKGENKMDFAIFSKTEVEEMFQTMLEHMPDNMKELAIKEFGSVEEWKKHYIEAVSSEEMQKGYAKVVEWYGGKEKYLSVVNNPISKDVADSYNKRIEAVLQKLIAKRNCDVNSSEVQEVVEEYGLLIKQFSQIKEEQGFMMAQAQYYRNERIKSMTDEKYGEGTADFLAQAIEAFYK